jgi:hypothetical protein
MPRDDRGQEDQGDAISEKAYYDRLAKAIMDFEEYL